MTVVFSKEAEDHLSALYNYIADVASAEIAQRYTDKLADYCHSLSTFPNRGTRHDDLRPGLRMTHYRGRTLIAFVVGNERVEIVGVFHGGQNYSTLL